MTAQYGQPWINYQIDEAATTFIFDSTLATQSNVAFNDWDDLMAQLQHCQGQKTIFFPTMSSTIPAGTYDMTDVTLRGIDLVTSVVDADDAVLNNLKAIKDMELRIGSISEVTVPTLSYDDGGTHILAVYNSLLLSGSQGGGAPMINVANGSTLVLASWGSVYASATILGEGGNPLIRVDDTSTLEAGGVNRAAAGNSWGNFKGAEAFIVVAGGGDAGLLLGSGDVYWAADNPSGFTSVARADDYEPADGADWTDADPTNLKDAVDRIAAAVAGLLAGPIP